MSEHRLLSTLKTSKSKIIFSKLGIEKIRKKFNELRHKFSKSKIDEIFMKSL